uniref:Uncharacterized protein n=1 Tax=Anas platyrhynchos platyrhynchos TaxID=8840 RepID=A0A493TZK9_ANAPP
AFFHCHPGLLGTSNPAGSASHAAGVTGVHHSRVLFRQMKGLVYFYAYSEAFVATES